MADHECTCGGNGICTACVLATLDAEARLMMIALDKTHAALARPVVHVAPLPGLRVVK
jgi:hypothetical protein